MEDFIDSKVPSQDELQLYTWPDCSLRELCEQIQKHNELARKKDTEIQFSFVFPDASGKYRRKEVGRVITGQRGQDEMKNL